MLIHNEKNSTIVANVVMATGLVLFLSAIAVFIYFHHYRKPTDEAYDEEEKGNDMAYIRLNEFEDRLLLTGGRLVSTITWYRGDHTEAAVHLQARFDRILLANPWMTGKIQRRRRWYPFGTNYLVYRKNIMSSSTKTANRISNGLFLHLAPSESPLSRYHTPMEDVSDIVRQHRLSCLPDYHHHIYRVAIVPCSKSPTTHFAVIVSMSHIAGDAHTFYALYNALMNFHPDGLRTASSSMSLAIETNATESSSMDLEVDSSTDSNNSEDNHQVNTNHDSTIPVLTVNRVSTYPIDMQHAMGSRRDSTLSVSLSFIIPSALSMVYGKLRNICSPTNQYKIERRYIRIDQDKIDGMKQEAIRVHPCHDNSNDHIHKQNIDQSHNIPTTHEDRDTAQPESPLSQRQPYDSSLNHHHHHHCSNSNNTNSTNRNTATFCSLNDVVTSWVLMNSKCRHGFMAINMRNRQLHHPNHPTDDNANHQDNFEESIEIYPDSLAGNYISLLYYQIPRNCSTPMLIRQSLSNLRRVECTSITSALSLPRTTQNEKTIPQQLPRSSSGTTTTSTSAPKPAPLLFFGGSIVVTNWCSFRNMTNHTTNGLPDVPSPSLPPPSTTTAAAAKTNPDHIRSSPSSFIIAEEIHYPLYTYQVDTHPYNTIIAILYRESIHENQIGLMLCGSPSRLDTLISSCPFEGSTCVA
jgi:hypothetical protein